MWCNVVPWIGGMTLRQHPAIERQPIPSLESVWPMSMLEAHIHTFRVADFEPQTPHLTADFWQCCMRNSYMYIEKT